MTGDAMFLAIGEHPMKKFVTLPDAASMREVGEHLPHVWREGKPVTTRA